MRAGFPTTTACDGTECVTTAPAPTMASRPIVTPGRIVALAPIEAPLAGPRSPGKLRDAACCAESGSLVNVAFGPTKTSSSSVNAVPELDACT